MHDHVTKAQIACKICVVVTKGLLRKSYCLTIKQLDRKLPQDNHARPEGILLDVVHRTSASPILRCF